MLSAVRDCAGLRWNRSEYVFSGVRVAADVDYPGRGA
jgi:hypothetical protein